MVNGFLHSILFMNGLMQKKQRTHSSTQLTPHPAQAELTSPAAVGIDVSLGSTGKVSFSILGNVCAYDAATGIFTCADKATQLPAGLTELHLIADRGILELSAKQDTVIAYWELPDDRTCETITVNADTPICAEAWTDSVKAACMNYRHFHNRYH